jgi:hypothetical protein
MKYLYLLTIMVIGLLLGFFMVLLLPAILGTWLTDWWASRVGTPHVCDAGAEPTPPLAEDAVKGAAEEVVKILRDAKAKSNSNLLEDAPIPSVFEQWIEQYKARHGLR